MNNNNYYTFVNEIYFYANTYSSEYQSLNEKFYKMTQIYDKVLPISYAYEIESFNEV